MAAEIQSKLIQEAVHVLNDGGVIAYPTEFCFGLGCDPRNQTAVEKILSIKCRKAEQGVILVAADLEQVAQYARLEAIPQLDRVTESWPGPFTWLLPAKDDVPTFIRGKHSSIAMRIPQHRFCLDLLSAFGHPIVSTSANRSGQAEHLTAQSVAQDMASECDLIIDSPVGGAQSASTIRDALSGATLR